MSIALDHFCFNSLLAKLTVVAFHTWSEVGGCRWSKKARAFHMDEASFSFSNADDVSVSAAGVITFCKILHKA